MFNAFNPAFMPPGAVAFDQGPALPPHLAPQTSYAGYDYGASAGMAMGYAGGESSTADAGHDEPHLHGSPKSKEEALAGGDDDGGKRRRVQRACDVSTPWSSGRISCSLTPADPVNHPQICRRKKIRCDGLQPGKSACTNCITYGHDCKFEEAAKRRAPPRAYVEALEARMERMEQLLVDLAPGVDFTERVGPPVRLPEENKDKTGTSPPTTYKSLPQPSIRRNEL